MRTPCKSAFGGQYFYEFSSSGMTHNCLTNEYDCHGLLNHVYTNTWKFSPYYMYFSFGGIRVSRSSTDSILVHLDILDVNGTQVLTHEINIS